MKKLIGFAGLLSICIMTLFCENKAYAGEINEYRYYTVGDEAFITEYIGDAKNVDIPDVIDGFHVKGISSRTFFDNSVIEEINIPAGISEIEATTFVSCLSLMQIDVSKDNQFFCSSQGVLYSKDKKTVYACPITKSGIYSIEDGVMTVGESAFAGTMMSVIMIPDSVVSIEANAFYNCDNIESVTIPTGVKNIGAGAFGACDELTGIYAAADSEKYMTKDGSLYSKNGSLIYAVASGKKGTFTIPSGVTNIMDYAFAGASFSEIVFGEDVRYVGDGAFYYADYLNKVVLNDKLISIGNYAFFMCTGLTDIKIKGDVREIGNYALAHCDSLVNVVFTRQNPPMIGDDAFLEDSELKRITVPERYMDRYKQLFTQLNVIYAVGEYDRTDISLCTVSSIPNAVYSGVRITDVTCTVYDGSWKLTKDVDYVCSYVNNVNVGTATVIIEGLGAYAGKTYRDFYIDTRSMADVKISAITNRVYTGGNIKPTFTVSYGSRSLVCGTDYKVTYLNNKDIGKASIRLEGINSFSSTRVIYFNIVPKKATTPALKSRTTSSICLKWSKTTGASYYQIYMYNSKKKAYVFVKSVYTNYYNVTKLTADTKYYFKIRAVTKKSNTCYYGEYSTASSIYTTVKAPTLKLTTKSKKVTIKWNKVSGATGYEVYMSTKKSSGYKKIKTYTSGSKISYVVSGLKKSKVYYYKVRAYKKINGVKVYGAYSTVKNIKVR